MAPWYGVRSCRHISLGRWPCAVSLLLAGVEGSSGRRICTALVSAGPWKLEPLQILKQTKDLERAARVMPPSPGSDRGLDWPMFNLLCIVALGPRWTEAGFVWTVEHGQWIVPLRSIPEKCESRRDLHRFGNERSSVPSVRMRRRRRKRKGLLGLLGARSKKEMRSGPINRPDVGPNRDGVQLEGARGRCRNVLENDGFTRDAYRTAASGPVTRTCGVSYACLYAEPHGVPDASRMRQGLPGATVNTRNAGRPWLGPCSATQAGLGQTASLPLLFPNAGVGYVPRTTLYLVHIRRRGDANRE